MLGTQESQKKPVPLLHRARRSRRKPEQTITIGFFKTCSSCSEQHGENGLEIAELLHRSSN